MRRSFAEIDGAPAVVEDEHVGLGLVALGLRVAETLPDSIPHPHENTVTRQQPVPGDSLPQGASVRLWYSTGLGNSFASVPDVTGLTVREAQQALLENKLRSVVIGAREDEDLAEQVVQRQSREPGTRVLEGFEIRLDVGDTLVIRNEDVFSRNGDNWSADDTRQCIEMLRNDILPHANQFAYGQVESPYGSGEFIHALASLTLDDPGRLVLSEIPDREAIYDSIKTFFGKGH